MLEKGLNFEIRKDYKEAINVYKKSIKLDQNNLNAVLRIACLHSNSGATEKGMKYYKHALRLEQNNTEALYCLGKLIHNSNANMEEAGKLYQRVID